MEKAFLILFMLLFITSFYYSTNDILTNKTHKRKAVSVLKIQHIRELNELDKFHMDYRLPGTTRPLYYDIIWHVELSAKNYFGMVKIQLVATRHNVDQIVINSHKLMLKTVDLSYDGETIPSSFKEDNEHQLLIVELERGSLRYSPKYEWVYTLTIYYAQKFRKDMRGVYEGHYRDNGTDRLRSIVATQFEPTEARTAFPCYDEPGYKATFGITIVRPKNYTSWTGTRLLNSTVYTENKIIDIFERTPLMSTYTIGFIIAEFGTISTSTGGNSVYEFIARHGALVHNHQNFAYTLGQELLRIMGDYTGIYYYDVSPNTKLTHAAVPDFLPAGMENWGLVMYREIRLMYEPTVCSDNIKEDVILVMAFETAHMWFGNMVTCKFWDSAWLNEGFAKYFEYYLADKVYPGMQFKTLFITKTLHPALLADSVSSSYPLTNPKVGSPQSIHEMFRTITYNKGAAVIRMTEHLLGSEVFKKGIKKYLKDRYFNTSEPIDLFRALKIVALSSGALGNYDSSFCLIEYYKTWTEQSGHPLLDVIVNHNTGIINIIQQKFQHYNEPVYSRWIIPITFTKASDPDFHNTKPSHIMREHFMSISTESVGDEWVLFNKQQIGFYRVNYDDYTWDLIIAALAAPNQSNIHEYNKAQIVDDTLQFARSKIMSYGRAFQIISFLVNETDYAPWAAAISGFQWLKNKLGDSPFMFKLNKKIIELSSKLMSQLTYYKMDPNEDHLRSRLRWMLARLLCDIKEPGCRRVANKKFNNLVNYNIQVPVNDRVWVYCNGLRGGPTTYYDFLWKRYQQIDIAAEKHEILCALGCTQDATKLNEFLHAIMKDYNYIRQQDFNTAIECALNGSERNTQVVFNFIKMYWNDYFTSHLYTKWILHTLLYRFRTEEEILKFFMWMEQRKITNVFFPEIYVHVSLARQSITWVKNLENELKLGLDFNGTIPRADAEYGNPETVSKLVARPIQISNINYMGVAYYIILFFAFVIIIHYVSCMIRIFFYIFNTLLY